MFFSYLYRELRRRKRQAMVVAVGLAIGIGLVMTVSATSAGVKSAQGQVLHSLYGVGTDMTVTKTATFGSGAPQHFGNFGNGSTSGAEPAAGTTISRNTLRPTPGEGALPESDVTKVAKLPGTSAATGGLILTDTSFSGTIPNSSSGAGGSFGSASGSGPSFNISSFTVDGVGTSTSTVGPLTPSAVTKGSYFSASDNTADVAIVTSSYANANDLGVGSSISVAGTALKVIGIADLPSGSADAYIPLGTAQQLAGLQGDVTDIFVSASSASSVSSLASQVQATIPGATVDTSATLAKEVTGSLASASNLATSLGKWLSIIALIVAFLVAGLLMMAAVSRRVREFGTLKAIGWRTRRVVGQVMGEGVVLGLLGGVAGIVLGIVGTEIVSAISPSLTATVGSPFATGGGFSGGQSSSSTFGNGGFASRFGGTPASGAPSGGGFSHAFTTAHTVLVHLTAPLQGGTIGLAIALAIGGGLVAGAFGAWRAARLRPAAALRRVE